MKSASAAGQAAALLVAVTLAVASPAGADPGRPRGVSDTTITVGVLRLKPPGSETLADVGLETPSVPVDAYWESVVADLHARGGVAGRTIQTVYHDMDITRAPFERRTMLAAACETFTREHEVFAVLDGWYFKDQEWLRCLTDAGVLLLSGNYSEVDDTLAGRSLYVDVNAVSLDRMARLLVREFDRRGFFDGGRLGLVRLAVPPWERAVERSLIPALDALEVPVAAEAVIASSDDHRRAVQQLRAADVDRVLFFLHGGPVAYANARGFLAAARDQSYFPRLALSSQDDLPSLARFFPPAQLDGAIAQGWTPYGDVAAGQDDRDWPARERCRQVTGVAPGDGHRDRDWTAMHACDWGELLKLVADVAEEPLSARTFLGALDTVGERFRSAVVDRTAFGPGRRDGVIDHRDVAYDVGCLCFRYVSEDRILDPPAAPEGVDGDPAPDRERGPPQPPGPAPVQAQPPAPPVHAPPGPAPAAGPQPAGLVAPQPGAINLVAQPGAATAPAAQTVPASGAAPSAMAAQQVAAGNGAVVPVPNDAQHVPRYAASSRDVPATPVATWMLLIAGAWLGPAGLALRQRRARPLSYAWGRG